jgi:hypothetical protein
MNITDRVSWKQIKKKQVFFAGNLIEEEEKSWQTHFE